MSLYRASSRPEMSTLPPTQTSMKRIVDLQLESPTGGSLRFDTGRIRRNIQKQFSRTREKMRTEKPERNDDEYIKKCEIIVTKKQTSTVKLQTELKRHLKALKNVTASSRSLYETILEAYEDNWSGRKQFSEAFLGYDSYWPTYHNNLCTVMEQVTTKLAEFVALRDKLEKRKRKAMDFNIVERNMKEAMSTKRRDPTKLKKAEREVEIMRRAYSEIHSEVSRDLPRFYDDHVHFCCENWAFLLENEKHMHDHLSCTVNTFMDSVDQLRIGYQQKLYQLEGVDVSYSEISRSTLSLHNPNHNGRYNDLYEQVGPRERAESGPDLHGQTRLGGIVSRHSSTISNQVSGPHCGPFVRQSIPGNRSHSMDDMLNADDDSDGYGTIDIPSSRSNGSETLPLASSLQNGPSRLQPPESESDGEDHVYAKPNLKKKLNRPKDEEREEDGRFSKSSPSSSLSSNQRRKSNASSGKGEKPVPPPKVKESLKMMIAVHSYEKQNDDELELVANDLVQILPWEDESLKEDGWLFGMKLPGGHKGLFPENHTEPYNFGN